MGDQVKEKILFPMALLLPVHVIYFVTGLKMRMRHDDNDDEDKM